MSDVIDLETVGCDGHHNGRIAELSGSLQLRDYPADVVRLSYAKYERRPFDGNRLARRFSRAAERRPFAGMRPFLFSDA